MRALSLHLIPYIFLTNTVLMASTSFHSNNIFISSSNCRYPKTILCNSHGNVILAAFKSYGFVHIFCRDNSPAAYTMKFIWCRKFIKVTYSSHWSLVLMMFSCHNATFSERFLCIANYYAHCSKPDFTHFFLPQLTLGNTVNCSSYSICCFPGFLFLYSKTSYTTSLVQLGSALHLVPSVMF